VRGDRGFTLLELVVSVALLGLVAAAGAAVVASVVRLASAAKRWSEAEHHARTVLERIMVSLRAAGYGAVDRLSIADRSRVEYLADFSADPAGPERRGFYLGSDGVLREISGSSVSPLTTQEQGFRVSSFELAYFDRDGLELGPPPLDAERRRRVSRVRIRAAFDFTDVRQTWRQLAVEEHVAVRLAGEE